MTVPKIPLLSGIRDHQPTTCSKCGKTIKPGKLLVQEGKQSYCYHCASALFYAFWREKFKSDMD